MPERKKGGKNMKEKEKKWAVIGVVAVGIVASIVIGVIAANKKNETEA